MPARLRLFISSPGDVFKERLRVELVVDRLGQDYRRYFALETYRWEYEPMLATGHPPARDRQISRHRRPRAGHGHGVGIRGSPAGLASER